MASIFRMRNPITRTQVLLMAGTVAVVFLATGGIAYAASKRRKELVPTRPPIVPPVIPDGEEPIGPIVPPAVPPDTLEWRVVTPDDPGYPWTFPAMHYENYPTPGTWFDANDKDGAFAPSNGFDRFVVALLGSALAMAGNDYRIANAVGQDPNANLGRRLRRQVRESLINVGGINDLLYGQTNLNIAGGNDPNASGGDKEKPLSAQYVLNEEGRGLNWLPRHADNIDRLQGGKHMKRTTRINGKKLPSPNSGSRQMLIWSPAFDLEALGPDKVVPSIRFLQWDDGSSTLDPPPIISQVGINLSGVTLPGVG